MVTLVRVQNQWRLPVDDNWVAYHLTSTSLPNGCNANSYGSGAVAALAPLCTKKEASQLFHYTLSGKTPPFFSSQYVSAYAYLSLRPHYFDVDLLALSTCPTVVPRLLEEHHITRCPLPHHQVPHLSSTQLPLARAELPLGVAEVLMLVPSPSSLKLQRSCQR